MKKYSKYKNTNIEWLDQIPEHWEETRLRNLGFLYGGLSGKSSKDFNDQKNPNAKFYIPFMNIANNFKINTTFLDRVNISENEIQNEVRKGDLFFLMSSENYDDVGKTAVLDNEIPNTYLNSFCKGFRFTDDTINSIYLNYHLSSKELRHNLLTEANGFTRINLKIGKVKDLFIAVPPLPEQKAIAEYLDKKTSEIDQIIDAKKKLIALYNEEKAALINRAVTKGIDDKAKLKPSGVEWLGNIPQHWEVTRLANFGKFLKGKGISKSVLTKEGIQAVVYGDIYTKYNIKTDKFVRNIPEEISKDSLEIFKDDLLFTASGETKEDIGKCILFIGNEPAFAGGDVIIFRQLINNSLFLSYLFNSNKIREQKAKLSKGQIVVHIYSGQLRDINFGLPPLKEQEKIVEYIEKNISVIDKKIANAKRLIELMTEYRTTLISEVVTGKVKVV